MMVKSSMRIGLYSTAMLPSKPVLEKYGGIEVTVGNLAQWLDKQGHEVHLFAAEGSYEPKNGELHAFDNDVLEEGPERELAMYKSYDKDLLKSMDIIHDNSHWHFPGVLVPGVPYTFVIHTVRPNIRHFKPEYDYCGVTQCNDMAKFQQWLCPLRFRTVYSGVNLDAFPYKEEKGDRLLWISRLFPPKGAEIAIKVAEKSKTPIDIVGSSSIDVPAYTSKIKRMCNNSKYATFVGEVSHKEKVEYLQNAKALILPIKFMLNALGEKTEIWSEAFCLTPLEALSCGTPVIASPSGVISECVHDGITGFLAVHEMDFIDKIKRLKEISPEMCRCRAEYFSFDKTAERYLQLYEEIIEGKTW